ncbi:MAG: hypothetical protein C4523_11465 [Myxococcales bacterium]|nr:MAG: hypothetical protein C4523_11465 [Myxococcales bacterium]
MSDELKQRIMDWFIDKSKGAKKKFYLRDVVEALSDANKKDVQKTVNALITEDKLMYWSSGSTTMICLPENMHAPNE